MRRGQKREKWFRLIRREGGVSDVCIDWRGNVKRTGILAIVSLTIKDEIDDEDEDLLGKR